MKKKFEIDATTPFELVRYTSQLTAAPELVESGEMRWLELCDEVIELANKNISAEQRWLDFKLMFFGQWQFAIADNEYFSVQSNNLFSLMSERQSNNTLMAIIVADLLEMLDLGAKIIDLPGPLVIQLGGLDGQYINPLTGEELNLATIEALVRGHLGDHIRLCDEHLNVAGNEVIKKRFLINLKQACLLEQQFEDALLCNQLLLDILPNDPQQRMERGFVLQQLDCFKGASDDFSFFIDNCPDDPNSDVLKMHIKILEQQTNIYH